MATAREKNREDEEGAVVDELLCRLEENGKWSCVAPYKHQLIQQELDKIVEGVLGSASNEDGKTSNENSNEDMGRIANKLTEMGIRVYVVTSQSQDLHRDLLQISRDVSNENRRTLREDRRCCLYKDDEGRVYNVVVSGGSGGLASSWQSLLVSFSGFEATAALVVLCRSFACIPSFENAGLRPAYLSLILGLVLTEEISYAWLNASMFVLGTPSIGAHVLQASFSSDWTRKLVVFLLAVAGAASGSTRQKYITLIGVALACFILAANLGSRAWRNLSLKTIPYSGPGAPLLAFVVAALAGFAFPYLGFREVEMGGQVALENTLVSALFLAIIFVISDLDQIQKFILVGSEQCNQDILNAIIGCWYTVSLLASMAMHKRLENKTKRKVDDGGEDYEPFLVEDQTSIVGYVVPNIPHFPIDPSLDVTPAFPLSTETCDRVWGCFMAIVLGGAIAAMGFTTIDDEVFRGG